MSAKHQRNTEITVCHRHMYREHEELREKAGFQGGIYLLADPVRHIPATASPALMWEGHPSPETEG